MLDTETARIETLIEKNERVLGLLAIRAARVLEDEVFSANARPVGIHYLATYVNGFPFKPEDISDEGIPIVRIAQLLGDTREQDFYAGTPDAYCHIDSGDLIFSWSATLAAKIWDGGPAFLNQHLFIVKPHEHVDRDWLLHALNAAVPRMKALTHGSTMTHITRPMMTKIRVPKPSLREQRTIAERIAVRFAKLDALRTKIDYQQALLRLRRQALITAAVTGQIEA
jgi:type I restriction enzyme S subunit